MIHCLKPASTNLGELILGTQRKQWNFLKRLTVVESYSPLRPSAMCVLGWAELGIAESPHFLRCQTRSTAVSLYNYIIFKKKNSQSQLHPVLNKAWRHGASAVITLWAAKLKFHPASFSLGIKCSYHTSWPWTIQRLSSRLLCSERPTVVMNFEFACGRTIWIQIWFSCNGTGAAQPS